MECPNCDSYVKTSWSHCPECGVNLKDKKYSKEDDPLKNLRKDVDKIKAHLEEEHKKKQENTDGSKKKTLFGD